MEMAIILNPWYVWIVTTAFALSKKREDKMRHINIEERREISLGAFPTWILKPLPLTLHAWVVNFLIHSMIMTTGQP